KNILIACFNLRHYTNFSSAYRFYCVLLCKIFILEAKTTSIQMITRILTIVFTLVAIGIAYYLVDRIKFAIDEEKRIAQVERPIIDKLMFIRDVQVAYKEANGQYTSDWDKLINFIDTGTIYITHS